MQINDDLISKLRMFRKGVIESGSADIKMPIYSIPISHTCQDTTFLDKGYYKKHNKEICLCKQGQEFAADFRILECETCHQEFFLLNTGIQNWDNIPNLLKDNGEEKLKN